MCSRLFPQDQLEALNFEQEDRDFKDGYYIQEYIVHGFKTLSQEEYEDQKARYDQLAASYGYKEYKVYGSLFRRMVSQGPAEGPAVGRRRVHQRFCGGQGSRAAEKWKIFELGMM